MSAQDRESGITFGASLRVIGRTLTLSWRLDSWQVSLYGVGAIMEVAGTIVSTYASAQLIGLLFSASTNSAERTEVWEWLAVTISGQLAVSLGFWLMNYSRQVLFLLASRWSSLEFMRQLCEIDIEAFQNTNSRNLINKLDNGHGWQISQMVSGALDLAYGCVRAVAIIGAVASVAWWIAPFLALFLIPSLVAEAKTARTRWFVWDEKGDERHVFWGIAHLMTRAVSQLEIRALQAKRALVGILDRMLTKFQRQQIEILSAANISIAPSKAFEIVGIALAEVWLLVQLLYHQALDVSSYVFYSGLIARVNGALNAVVGGYTSLQESILYAHDFYGFLKLQPKIDGHEARGIKLPDDEVPEIRFEHVWFKYPGSTQWVFQDLNLTIGAGEHVALVGENGAGKTTIVKLLLRFYEVNRGAILVNGHNLNSLDLSSWYQQLGTLFQEFNNYPLDVRHNITIGGRTTVLDQKKFDRAIKDSGVASIAKRLPFGLDTVLDSSFQKGTQPSGGQWQRVALARAFYRDANILILDEPTAAIDAKAEYDIFNNIFAHQSEKSTIIISHRFSTVRRADRIIVIEKGKIVEEGSHQELMRHSRGLYKEMFDKQAEGYR